MADLEKTPVITFRTDDSGMVKGVTSVKELKTAIAQLKDEIVRMRQAGEDTTKATSDLQAAQRELNTVMGLTKKGADGVEGSYDSLVAKLREAKTEWRALPKFIEGELNPAWEKARQEVEKYNDELKNYDASVGVYTRNVGNYKSALEGFTGTMGQAAQVGGDFRNGLQAISSFMLMAGVNTDGMNDAMKGLQITVGVLQGLKGFGGLLKQLGDYFKASAKAATATKADTSAKNENTAATTAMAGAEAGATVASTALKVALDALGIGLIVGAVALLVTHIQDITNWIGKLAEKLGIVKKQTKEWEGANERLTNRFEDQNRELQLQQRVLAAQGVTKKALLEQQKTQIQLQINETKATIANIEARVKQMQADSGWVRFWKGENRQIKKAQEEVEELTKSLKGLYQSMEEVNVDIKVEEITTDNAKKGAAAKASEAAMQAIETAAKKAQAEIDKILDSQYTGIEKIKREYKALFTALEGYQKDLEAAGKDTSMIGPARAILEQQQTEKLREEYKKQYSAKLKSYEDSIAIDRKAEDQRQEVYRGLAATLRGESAVRVEIERETAEILRMRNERDIKVAQDVLQTVVSAEDYAKFLKFKRLTEDELLDMYKSMLRDSERFSKEWPEPFMTALQSIGPKILENRESTSQALTKFVADTMAAYEEAVNKNDFKAAAKLKDQLLGNPPVSDDAGLKAAAEDFIKRMDKQMYAAIGESDNPLAVYLSGTTWGEVFKSNTEKFRKILDDDTATWRQQWEARGSIMAEFFRKYDKFLSSYGTSTANVLGNTTNLWSALIDAKQKDIDKQKDEGKISEKEYKRRTEQNKKSFDNLKSLQIATAVINTASAVVAALADMSVPFYVRLANSVAAGIAGAAEIVKIKSTDFGSGSYSAGASAPTITQSAPMVNTYGINPADYAEANAQNPVRVYVLESDITEAQNSARVRVSEATF